MATTRSDATAPAETMEAAAQAAMPVAPGTAVVDVQDASAVAAPVGLEALAQTQELAEAVAQNQPPVVEASDASSSGVQASGATEESVSATTAVNKEVTNDAQPVVEAEGAQVADAVQQDIEKTEEEVDVEQQQEEAPATGDAVIEDNMGAEDVTMAGVDAVEEESEDVVMEDAAAGEEVEEQEAPKSTDQTQQPTNQTTLTPIEGIDSVGEQPQEKEGHEQVQQEKEQTLEVTGDQAQTQENEAARKEIPSKEETSMQAQELQQETEAEAAKPKAQGDVVPAQVSSPSTPAVADGEKKSVEVASSEETQSAHTKDNADTSQITDATTPPAADGDGDSDDDDLDDKKPKVQAPPAGNQEVKSVATASAVATDAVTTGEAESAATDPHGEDEYDPANPSHDAVETFTSYRPAYEQDEYDPEHPSMTPPSVTDPATAEKEPTSVNMQDSTANASGSSVETVSSPAKRKVQDDATAGHTGETKRARHDRDNDQGSRDSDRHHDHGNDDAVSSPGSNKSKPPHEDHKGLAAAAWDRLMDFQTSGDFRITQVSRAAFASVGAMPEFAQIAIVARFTRTPMRDVRDKNGQLMRIYREYQKENPQVGALQPVSAFISDYKSDPGLFRFGYAPPQPTSGVSSVPVPYQRDQPVEKEEPPVVKSSPPPAKRAATAPRTASQQPNVDEFGRAIHPGRSSAALQSTESTRGSSQRPAVGPTDPRRNSRSHQSSPPRARNNHREVHAPAHATARPSGEGLLPVSAGRPLDPRRREQYSPRSFAAFGANTTAPGRDPRRRGALGSQPPQAEPVNSGSSRGGSTSDLYSRLPSSVKAVVDSMRCEGRLQQPLNDNVVSRLLDMPEHVALQAVENFSNVDLTQVENLQGFLVGIINRVNEKALAADKQQQRHQQMAPSAPGGSVLGGPPVNAVNGGGFRSMAPPGPAGAGANPPRALYERPYEAPADPRRQPQRMQGAPAYAGGPAPAGGGPGGHVSGPRGFPGLPASVQGHIMALVANGSLASVDELSPKCYDVLGELSEPLANQVLNRFAGAKLATVRNRGGFLMGVVKRFRQEYGFNN